MYTIHITVSYAYKNKVGHRRWKGSNSSCKSEHTLVLAPATSHQIKAIFFTGDTPGHAPSRVSLPTNLERTERPPPGLPRCVRRSSRRGKALSLHDEALLLLARLGADVRGEQLCVDVAHLSKSPARMLSTTHSLISPQMRGTPPRRRSAAAGSAKTAITFIIGVDRKGCLQAIWLRHPYRSSVMFSPEPIILCRLFY